MVMKTCVFMSYKSRFICLCLYLFNHLGRNTTNNRIRFNVFSHNSSCGHYGSITDGNTGKYRCVGTNPNVFPYMDGSIAHALALSRVKVMVERCQHDIMPDECSLVDGDAALILELAAHVYEYTLAYDGILTAIGMEWWEQAYRLGNFTSPKLLQ